MKEINTKEMMNAYKEARSVERRLSYEEKLMREGSRFADENRVKVLKMSHEAAVKKFMDVSAPLSAAISEAQKRCRERCISALDVMKKLDGITDGLKIFKKDMDGIRVSVNIHAQTFPNAYKGIPESTYFNAEYRDGSWRVYNVARYRCYNREFEITLTDQAKEAIISRFEKGDF